MFKQSAFCVTLVLSFICVVVISGQDFQYVGQNGPQNWAKDYKRCSGKYQSPINIEEVNVKLKKFPDIEYINFDVTPKRVKLTNNDHTVLVTMTFEEGMEPRIKGGPLERKSEYQFEQFHFHWGQNDSIGSEDLVNNHAYPAELHVVMRSLDYKDFKSAMGQDHGIVVLAFFLKVFTKDNPVYQDFVESLPFIRDKDTIVELLEPLPLIKFLPSSLIYYYTYVGSLTTPPCSEKVVWIDGMDSILISEKQLNLFRQLTLNDVHLRNNYRPTQPINDRIIYENDIAVIDNIQFGFSAIPFVDADNAAKKYCHFGIATLVPVLFTLVN